MDKGSKRSGRSRKKRKESVEECKEGSTDDSARSKRPRRKSRGKESEEDEEKKNPRDRERRARAKKVPSKRKTSTPFRQSKRLRKEDPDPVGAGDTRASSSDPVGISEMEGSDGSDGRPGGFSSFLQSLSRGGGLAMGGGGASKNRLVSLIEAVQADGDETRQLDGVMQLCDFVSMATEESLSGCGVPVDAIVGAVVPLLALEHNPNLVLLAARVLTYIVEVMPGAANAVVNAPNAVMMLCSKLLVITYDTIDVAEQALSAMSKLSVEHSGALLQNGGLMACLQYLDFFPLPVQRTAVRTAANICRVVPDSSFPVVLDSLPLISALLMRSDREILEQALLALVRTCDCCYSVGSLDNTTDRLQQIAANGVLGAIITMLDKSEATGVPNTATSVTIFRLIASLCRGSSSVVRQLAHADTDLVELLCAYLDAPRSTFQGALDRCEILMCIGEMLPRLPAELTPIQSARGMFSIPKRSTGGSRQTRLDEVSDEKIEYYTGDGREVLASMASRLFPRLMSLFGTTASPKVRHSTLVAISKLLDQSTPESLTEILRNQSCSAFVATMLQSSDLAVVASGLVLADLLMLKLPDIFRVHFRREGVLFGIKKLVSKAPSDVGEDQEAAEGKSPSASRSGLVAALAESASLGSPLAFGSITTVLRSGNAPVDADAMRRWIAARAVEFAQKHTPELDVSENTSMEESCGTDLLAELRDLGEAFIDLAHEEPSDDTRLQWSDDLKRAFRRLRDALLGDDGVSTFEFVHSGCASGLLEVLSYWKEGCQSSMQLLMRRWAMFRAEFVGELNDGHVSRDRCRPFELLVKTLQNSLSHLECLPLCVFDAGDVNSLGSGSLKLLTQPFRLRLVPESEGTTLDISAASEGDGDGGIEGQGGNCVMIEPLASMAAVAQYVLNRIMAQPKNEGESVQSDGEASGKKKKGFKFGLRKRSSKRVEVTEDGSRDEQKRLLHALAVRRKRRQQEQEQHAAMSSHVHELRLSDESAEADGPAPGSPFTPSKPLRMSASSSAPSPMSPPVALVGSPPPPMPTMSPPSSPAGVPDSMVVEEEPPKPRVMLWMDGELLKPEQSIIQVAMRALLRDPDAQANRLQKKRALWEKIHTIVYKLEGENSASSSTAPMEVENEAVDKTVSFEGSELLEAIRSLASDKFGRLDSMDAVEEVQSPLSFGSKGFHGLRRSGASDNGMSMEIEQSLRSSDPINIPGLRSSGGVEHAFSPLSRSRELPSESNTSMNAMTVMMKLLKLMASFNENYHTTTTNEQDTTASLDTTPGHIVAFKRPPSSLLPQRCFVSEKLTATLQRQLCDTLSLTSNALPEWCGRITASYRPLVSFESRLMHWQCTSLGVTRALQAIQSSQSDSDLVEGGIRIARIQRQKVRISRHRLFECAERVLELYATTKSVLEVEYFGEEGTGLGPTLEFFTLVSREFQQVDKGMWLVEESRKEKRKAAVTITPPSSEASSSGRQSLRASRSTAKDGDAEGAVPLDGSEDDMETVEYVSNVHGLFPAPVCPSGDATRQERLFRVLGLLVGKALMDDRRLDLPLSRPFFKALSGAQLSFEDFFMVYPTMAHSIANLLRLVERKKVIECNPALTEEEKELQFKTITLSGVELEDLFLFFTVPGQEEFELKPGGASVQVTIKNLEDYIKLLLQAYLVDGVTRQLKAFKRGVNEVLPYSSLDSFSPEELQELLCGWMSAGPWDRTMISEALVADHGYTMESRAVQWLIDEMCSMNGEQQRKFLLFTCGTPQLRLGGFKNLQPRMTVVRKDVHPPDHYLPSVMTCANYIKLPDYSSQEVLREKLWLAVNEGHSCFHLS